MEVQMYKKEAQKLKAKAKELNIDLKLTHCQELVAEFHGFPNRHAMFCQETSVENIDPIMQKYFDNLKRGLFYSKFVLGYEKNEFIVKDFVKEPHLLIINDIARNNDLPFTLKTWLLSNKNDDTVIISNRNSIKSEVAAFQEKSYVRYIPSKEESIKEYFDYLINIIEERQSIFSRTDSINISDYEEKTNERLLKHLFYIDSIPLDIQLNEKTMNEKDSLSFKYNLILKSGRAYGVWCIRNVDKLQANSNHYIFANRIDEPIKDIYRLISESNLQFKIPNLSNKIIFDWLKKQ